MRKMSNVEIVKEAERAAKMFGLADRFDFQKRLDHLDISRAPEEEEEEISFGDLSSMISNMLDSIEGREE